MKSYVTVEQHVCPVCGKVHDTGSILLDRRMKDTFESTTTTGYGLCPEHQKLFDEGYVALVEAADNGSQKMKIEEARRLGRIIHIRREKAREMFNIPFPDDLPFMWVQPEVCDMLERLEQQRKEAEG